jgi:hypothetical protein
MSHRMLSGFHDAENFEGLAAGLAVCPYSLWRVVFPRLAYR